MTTKATFFINQVQAAEYNATTNTTTGVTAYDGESESWYTDSAFNSTAQYNSCISYMRKRAALLPSNATIVAFRIREEGAKGKTVLYRNPIVGANPGIADISEAALKFTFDSQTTASQRVFSLAMLPDDLLKGGVFVQYQNFTQWMRDFANEITKSWMIKAIDQTVPVFDVDTIDVNGNVTLLDASDIIATSKCQILHSKTPEGRTASGTFKIKGWTDNKHFQLKDWKFPASSGGQARRFTQNYQQVQIYDQNRLHPVVGTRKIGRPFGLSRGKASTKR